LVPPHYGQSPLGLPQNFEKANNCGINDTASSNLQHGFISTYLNPFITSSVIYQERENNASQDDQQHF
jgi:hypothetical protein